MADQRHRLRRRGAAGGDGAGGGGLADRAGAAAPGADRAARPAAELLPRGPRRAGAARSRAGRGAAQGRRRAAAARGADRDQGSKSTSPARSDHPRHRRLHRARPRPTREMVRRLREAGAIVVGQTLLPELAICGFTESATYGVTRNPWNPQRTPARLQRRQRRGGRRRPGPDRLGLRRRRLDPHPRRLLRPLRPEATARPDLAGARIAKHWNGLSVDGCVSRTVLDTALWLDVTSGGSEEPGAPRAAGAPLRRVGEDAAGQAAGRLLDPRRRAPRRRRPSPTSSRTRSPRPPSCCARSATRPPSRIPTGG